MWIQNFDSLDPATQVLGIMKWFLQDRTPPYYQINASTNPNIEPLNLTNLRRRLNISYAEDIGRKFVFNISF